MRALILSVIVLVVVTPSEAQDKKKKRKRDGKDDVVGTIWAFTARNGSEVEKGQFRVHLKEVFKGGEKVGVVIPKDADETTMVIDGFKKLNGKVVLKRIRRNPTVWAGTLLRTDGSKWNITIDVKDK